MIQLSRKPNLSTLTDLSAMAVAGVLALASGAAFIVLLLPALISSFLAFAAWYFALFAVWAWCALTLAAWHIVRGIELVNAPSWKALAFFAFRSAMIALTCPVLWIRAFGLSV